MRIFVKIIFLQDHVISCPSNKSDVEHGAHFNEDENKSNIRMLFEVDKFNSVIKSPSNGQVGNMLSAYASLMVSALP